MSKCELFGIKKKLILSIPYRILTVYIKNKLNIL